MKTHLLFFFPKKRLEAPWGRLPAVLTKKAAQSTLGGRRCATPIKSRVDPERRPAINPAFLPYIPSVISFQSLIWMTTQKAQFPFFDNGVGILQRQFRHHLSP
jgi:hypothetical protein